jgi:hypothetical protein
VRLHRLRTLASRVAEVRRATGLPRLPATLARGLVVREYLVTERRLIASPVPRLPDGIRIGPVTEADLPAALAAHPALSLDEIGRRWREGQAWTGCWVDGTLAHWRWEAVGLAYLPYLRRRVRPLPGDLWVVEVFTRLGYRNRGLHSLSTAYAFATAAESGHGRVIGLVSPWNRPGIHVMVDKWRRTPVGRVGYVGIGPWRRDFVQGRVAVDEAGALFVPIAATGAPGTGSARADREEHRSTR